MTQTLTNKSRQELEKIAEAVIELEHRQKYHKLNYVFPMEGEYSRDKYPVAMGFFKAGTTHRLRVFMGGNRSGKSFTMATELAYHVTGEYPDWWEGKRFKNIKTVWIVAESANLFRDSLQKLLFGDPGEDVGTGLIPLAEQNNGVGIIKTSPIPNGGGGIGVALVRHKKQHVVSIVLKTNEMDREQFQAAQVDLIAFDEEPKEAIYTECILRLMKVGTKEGGIAMFAFTPLKGFSSVVQNFLRDGEWPERGEVIEDRHRYVCRAEWDDAPHLSQEEKDFMLSEIPVHMREARKKGIPSMGSGKIYPVEEEFVIVKPFPIPDYYKVAYGLDFASPNGWTAAIWVAQDPTDGVFYVYSEYKRTAVIDDYHIHAIMSKGSWIKGGCDPHSGVRDDGTKRMEYYREHGLDLEIGDNTIITGIATILGLLETGKLKFMSNCEMLRKEYRLYRYDEKDPNKPALKQDDHLLDALRYVISIFDWIAKSKDELIRRKQPSFKSSRKHDPWTGY